MQGVGYLRTDDEKAYDDEKQMEYLKEWRKKHRKEKKMQVEVRAKIFYDNIDKPDQCFLESEWAETIKDFTGADEVEIIEVNYWDSTEDDMAIDWD